MTDSQLKLNDVLFASLAGWDVVKQARSLLASGRVLNSNWEPPRLSGSVQEGTFTYRSGLIIKNASDADNLCTCRDARQRGIICAHAVAVGLHYVRQHTPMPLVPSVKPQPPSVSAPKRTAKALLRAKPGEDGEPLEIVLILPPNFVQAAEKGKVMLCPEGVWEQGRAPLNALPKDVAFFLSAEDTKLLDGLEALSDGDTPGMVVINLAQFADLLQRLVGHPNVTFGKSQSVQITREAVRCSIEASLEGNGEIVLRLVGALPPCLIPGSRETWALVGNIFRPLAFSGHLVELSRGSVRVPRSRVPQFLSIDWPAIASQCDVKSNFSPSDFSLETAEPQFDLHLAGGIAMLEAKLSCHYGDKSVAPGTLQPNESLWIADPKNPRRYSTRNVNAEHAAVARLTRNGFSGPDANGSYHLKDQNRVLSFFAREHARLEKEWNVTLEERLERSTEKNFERIEPSFQIIPSGENWFDLDVAYTSTGGERFSNADIHRLLRSGQNHTRLTNGKLALIDTGAVEELQEVLLDCAPQQHREGYRLNNAQAGFLDAALRGNSEWKVNAPVTWTQRMAQQRGDVKLETPALNHLESVLRPYQKTGVAWLYFLRRNNFGGILADEMGLGKTLQVLALIDAVKKRGECSSPVLVVCPTSLVFNWAAEAVHFVPELKVLMLHGAQRHEAFSRIAEQDLVITSYALLRRDLENYLSMEFDTVVLDEAQHIKNRQTQNAQAVKGVRCKHRLVLTGTPLENSVLDLWSIFDFLMPGYLGAAQDFRERYETPIVRDKDASVQNRLARRLRPFMLRRLKKEVAADLPEKIEQVSFCDLNKEQRALYQQILEASRKEIGDAVDAGGVAGSRMVILTALLRLRQVCCDLRLLNAASEKPTSTTEPSGKVSLFLELLEEVLDGGHRALVFSQFTSMLALLRDHLDGQEIGYSYLDGATRNRSEIVEQFQKVDGPAIFLISLKAGGVGLNLTAADTVIHFDPWWNPAVEAQATDRTHRIGQERVVTSYKLITRDTVEEKILNLQTRKRELIQSLLGGEEDLAQALSWDEIQELLAD